MLGQKEAKNGLWLKDLLLETVLKYDLFSQSVPRCVFRPFNSSLKFSALTKLLHLTLNLYLISISLSFACSLAQYLQLQSNRY